MHKSKSYKEMVVYMEACHAGSMFINKTAPVDMNIYVLTASNPNESSWGTYCHPDCLVDGKDMKTCLGDLFSVNWMHDTEGSNSTSETLEEQYTKVKKETNKSHVMQYGDLKMTSETIDEFEGAGQKDSEFASILDNFWGRAKNFAIQ
jgi:legumain